MKNDYFKNYTSHFRRSLLYMMLVVFITTGLNAQDLALAGLTTHLGRYNTEKQVKTLKSVLIELENKFQVNFAYEGKLIDEKYINVASLKDHESIEKTLEALLVPLKLKYKKIDSNLYVIQAESKKEIKKLEKIQQSKVNENTDGQNTQELTFVNRQPLNITVEKVQVNVKGTVTSLEDGQPLPGVNVFVQGTTVGTITDINGAYSIEVPDPNVTLVFSFIGYTTEEIPLNGRTTLDIAMAPDIKQLSEVVVVAYGTQKKTDLTSSITSLKAKELGSMPVASVDALLQGKAAGVQVVQNSGMPGGEIFVRIRGTNSLFGDSRPLYVIDGVPMTNGGGFLGGGGQRQAGLADVNPNDIESIEILKDAAAAALYGSRGSNGVVLITTKRGKTGDAKVNFDAFYGVQEVVKTFDMLNGQEYIDVLDEARINSNNPTFSELEYTGAETNWQDAIFRTAPISQYNVSVSGGNEKLTTFASMGIFDQSGTIIGQEFNRLNGRLNLDYNANKWLKIGNNTTFTNIKIDKVDNDFSSYSVLANALYSNPNVMPYNSDGSYGRDPLNSPIAENPVMIANDLTHNITTRRLISNFYGEVTFLKNFKLRSTFGIDYLAKREERYIPSYFVKQLGLANASAVASDEMVWQNENTLSYNNKFGDHTFGGLLGISFLESNSSYLWAGGNSAATDIITTIAITVPSPPSHNLGMWGLQSYFSRVNYGYKDKYMIEGSMRIDGSSRFGKNFRYGYFPSISGAWRVISEPFMKPMENIFADLKVRASHGSTGNQEGIDNFGSLTQYRPGANYDGLPGMYKSVVGNEDLKWETTVSTNLGIDLGLLNNRLIVNADFYLRKTKDLFYPLALPVTTGFTSIPRVNLGDLQNKGLELMVSTRNLVGEFKWSTDFNIAWNKNEITYLIETNGVSDRVIAPINFDGAEGPYGLFRVGAPVGNFYGYRYVGIWQSEEQIPTEWNPVGQPQRVWPGDVIFEDVDGNFAYQRIGDHQIIGNALPKHTGGITNNFSYKSLDLNVTMSWSYGNQIYNMTRAVLESMSKEYNQLASVRDRWTPENTTGSLPRARYGSTSTSGAANTDANSRFVEDGSFLRVRNVTLGYNLPSELANKVHLSNARIYVSGQNLITITNYSGLDPENQNLGSTQGAPSLGVDFLTQPQPRVIMLGLNIGL